jgi:hypothetical protein
MTTNAAAIEGRRDGGSKRGRGSGRRVGMGGAPMTASLLARLDAGTLVTAAASLLATARVNGSFASNEVVDTIYLKSAI